MLKGKKIILGITGSIAAYKACYIIRGLIKQGAEVQVVITPAGKEFITPITLSALTSKPVISEFFAQRDGTWNSHVDLGLWADAVLIAPATASTIGKMANGIADNMLITTYLSAKAPVFVAPAMDLDMFAHPATQKNLDILRSYGNHIIEPGTGELASHLVGKGRMEEPENIIRVLDEFFASSDELSGKKVMITAGPTYEKIDPVRFIGNYSSGKMGYSIAKACMLRGADVTLVTGRTALDAPLFVNTVPIVSAKDMYREVTSRSQDMDIIIKAAAVADYRPCNVSDEKIKKKDGDAMSIPLERTDDILRYLGEHKKAGQFLCGFSMETQNMLANSKKKLEKKNLDMIVANNLKERGAGFETDTNIVTMITPDQIFELELMSKEEVAFHLLDKILEIKNKM